MKQNEIKKANSSVIVSNNEEILSMVKDGGGCVLKILVPCLLYGLFIRAMDKNYSFGADVDPTGKFSVNFSPSETKENKDK